MKFKTKKVIIISILASILLFVCVPFVIISVYLYFDSYNSESGKDSIKYLEDGYKIVYFNGEEVYLCRETKNTDKSLGEIGDTIIDGRIVSYSYNKDYIAVENAADPQALVYSCIDIKDDKIIRQEVSKKRLDSYIKKKYKINEVKWIDF